MNTEAVVPTVTAPVTNEKGVRISAMFKTMKVLIENLHDRWQDEKEYEDIREYAAVVKKKLAAEFPDFTFVSMNKRPFGFTFFLETKVHYRVFANARQVGWRRV